MRPVPYMNATDLTPHAGARLRVHGRLYDYQMFELQRYAVSVEHVVEKVVVIERKPYHACHKGFALAEIHIYVFTYLGVEFQ